MSASGDRHLQLQHQQRQRNGDDAVGQREQALYTRDVLVVVLCRHPQELGRWRTAEAVIGSAARKEHPPDVRSGRATIVVMQLLAIASHPGTIRRLGGRRAALLAFACCLTLAVVAAGTVLGASSGGAATAGWYVAPTPGTGGDDILLGSSCANSVQCMAVGITLNNLDSNGTDTPLVEAWNGSSWTLGAQPPLPSRCRRRPLRRQLRQRIRLLGGRGCCRCGR